MSNDRNTLILFDIYIAFYNFTFDPLASLFDIQSVFFSYRLFFSYGGEGWLDSEETEKYSKFGSIRGQEVGHFQAS